MTKPAALKLLLALEGLAANIELTQAELRKAIREGRIV